MHFIKKNIINGIISVRTGSSRLENKCLLDLGGISVLEHIIIRCQLNNIKPIVCTTEEKRDNIIVKISKKLKVSYFRGPKKNKILRWYYCCKNFNLKYFHTIDADDPFFDGKSIKRSMELLQNKKLDIILPSKVSREGGASEGYSLTFQSLKKIIFGKNKKLTDPNYDTEILEGFIKNKKIKFLSLKGSAYEIKDARLTLDYYEDYKLLKKIVEICGNFSSRLFVNNFLRKNKNILKINAKKSYDWKLKQTLFLQKVK